ncbi:MAG: asparaginase [Hyphomonadaceae bacterium]
MQGQHKVLVIMTGGTIAQTAASDGKMQITRSAEDLVAQTGLDNVDTFTVGARIGANLTMDTAHAIAAKIMENEASYDGFVLIGGTDSMEELAYLLDLVIAIDAPVVLTGSMKPGDVLGYDGIANLQQAIMIASSPASRGRGVLVAMNDQVHVARYVRKADTQLIGAFQSHPGPVGEIRRGQLFFYYDNTRSTESFDWRVLPHTPRDVRVIFFCFDQPFSKHLFADADGAVIAGMGSASLSDEWIEALSPEWTGKMPIAVVSRAMKGANFNDSYYRGSLQKYEDRGFLLTDYVHLNPMQARIKLALSLAKAKHPG